MISQALITKQQGAVLVFSMVFLLLITLLGVNMVQQNRLQFMMAANSQMQTTSFVDMEDVMELGEYFIASNRYTTWPLPKPIPNPVGTTFTCNKTASGKFDQLKPRLLTDTELGLSADIIARSNPIVEILSTACMVVGDVEIPCTPDATTTSGWADSETQCYQSDQAQCITEIYTMQTTLTDASGSQRKVQSRYAVRCDM